MAPSFGEVAAIPVVLAHQGGWDEMLMVIVPIAVFALLLYIANNRASKLGDDDSPPGPGNHKTPPRNPHQGPI